MFIVLHIATRAFPDVEPFYRITFFIDIPRIFGIIFADLYVIHLYEFIVTGSEFLTFFYCLSPFFRVRLCNKKKQKKTNCAFFFTHFKTLELLN